MKLTINNIIKALGTDGVNSKGEVLKALKMANLNDLRTLRNSINEEINKREVSDGSREKL